jgi:hypothetical protein
MIARHLSDEPAICNGAFLHAAMGVLLGVALLCHACAGMLRILLSKGRVARTFRRLFSRFPS